MYIIHNYLIRYNHKLSAVESCTSGLVSSIITYHSESSKFFENGLVVYSDNAKIKNLKIDEEKLKKFTAVSEEICNDMLINYQKITNSDFVLATTGYADYYKNIQNSSLIFLGIKLFDKAPIIIKKKYNNDRNTNRIIATEDLIELLIENLPNINYNIA